MEGNMRCWSGSLVQAVNDDCAHFLLGHQKGTMPSRKDMKREEGERGDKKKKKESGGERNKNTVVV